METKECKFFENKHVACARCGKRIHKGKQFKRATPWGNLSEKEKVIVSGEIYKEVQVDVEIWKKEDDYCNKCEQRRK